MAKNSKANVSAAKGVAGGYIFWAPAGTALPDDNGTPLGSEFENLGFVGEDGVVFSDEADTDGFVDMNGETVDTAQTGYTSTFSVTLLEYKAATQRVLYGSGNVTDSAGTMAVHNRGEQPERGVCVLELLLKSKRKLRKVVPDCQVTEWGDLTAVSSEVYAREATFTAYKDEETGDYWVDYADSTETGAQTVEA